MCCDVCQQQDEDDDDEDDDDEVDVVAGENAEDVIEQDTEYASREKPRNIPASVSARPDNAASSTDTAGREQTPVVAFGTRKKSVPFLATFLAICYLFIYYENCTRGTMIKKAVTTQPVSRIRSYHGRK